MFVDDYIICRNITKRFRGGSSITVLENVNLTIGKSDFFTIIGPSGCGKSTLLKIIAGLVKPDDGEIIIEGKQHTFNPNKISIVFQEDALFPWRTAINNVAFGLEIRGVPKKERLEKARKILRELGLTGFENHYPRQLSGGMRQRVSIARALVLDTDIILMDEPFGALDEQTRLLAGEWLKDIWRKTGKTIIFVTHSLLEAIYLSTKIALMTSRPGKIKRVYDVNAMRLEYRSETKFMEDFRELLWNELKEEAMKNMAL